MTTEFVFENESHTLGNLINIELLKNPQVLFSAYKIEHPLRKQMSITLMTDSEKAGDEKQVLIDACKNLQKTVTDLQKLWSKA